MPKYIMTGSKGHNLTKESEGYYLPNKENFTELRSPRSPLSTQSLSLSTLTLDSDSLDLAINRVANTSIEQLYHNVCEMQSSDQSPSRLSFLSYGEESRIDSELRFLAVGDYGAVKEENEGNNTQKTSLRSKSFSCKPPNGKQSVKNLRAFSSMKNERSPHFIGKIEGHGKSKGYLGPYLLKQARDMMSSGDSNPQKALELAIRAMKSFEVSLTHKPNLDFVMCLHVVASLYCRVGMYNEAIPILERSINIPVVDLGKNHALAKFSGCMQLGDTYAMLGQIENSIRFYKTALEIQRQVLGEKDHRLRETCRYLAEAHVQAMQYDEAEQLCLMALDIHKENGSLASLEEASDRRLLGLICDSKGDYESALEHYTLARMALASKGLNSDIASIDCNIGDAYLSLARYDEAIFAYQNALNKFNSSKEENHSKVASIFVRLGDLYNKIGKFGEAKSFLENALRIYAKPVPGSLSEEIASGLVDISTIFESMDEQEKALELLKKAIEVYGNAPGHTSTIAGIEAQIGALYYILGIYYESYEYLKNAIEKFRALGEKKSAHFGIALNQMGLACVQLCLINEAASLFEEAGSVLETECGFFHAHTLGIYSNLSGTYDAMGRTADAIEILEYVVKMREEKLGTANSDVEDEKCRLAELLKEAGIVRNKKSRSLGTLLGNNSYYIRDQDKIEVQ
ncbi:hypothetical protein ACJIZ3_015060 [Penstemon smallii]|uniref:Uncharacterized protein n=1 Tax=Penstemon smallii TaxID=265156 RepID=A0ABD3RLE3_9LAMI